MTVKIHDLGEASFTGNFSFVQVQFLTGEKPINATLTLKSLDTVVRKLSELFRFVQSSILKKGHRFEVHAQQIIDAIAACDLGGTRVIFSLRGDNGLVQSLALPIPVSERFCTELEDANILAKSRNPH